MGPNFFQGVIMILGFALATYYSDKLFDSYFIGLIAGVIALIALARILGVE